MNSGHCPPYIFHSPSANGPFPQIYLHSVHDLSVYFDSWSILLALIFFP